MNYNNNKLHNKVTDHLCSNQSYKKENCSIHIQENLYKLWSTVKDFIE